MDTPAAIYDPRVSAAVVAAIVVAAGWFVAGFRELRRDRRRRRERSIDVQTALAAEIQHYVDILKNPEFDLKSVWEDVVRRMEADDGYIPLIPSEKNDTVFQSILSDVQILPEEVIRPVVRYYNQVFAIEAMIEDLRSEQFRSIETPQQQRIEMYTDYISLKLEALRLGEQACDEILSNLDPKNAARRVSNRAGDPSDL